MEPKIYSSYEEIDRELEILKIEKEIHFQRILLSVDKTKESILPSKSVSFVADMYQNVFSGWKGKLITFAVPQLIKWFINRKRGK